MKNKRHIIGFHGAVGFVTKDGRVCAECSERIEEDETQSSECKCHCHVGDIICGCCCGSNNCKREVRSCEHCQPVKSVPEKTRSTEGEPLNLGDSSNKLGGWEERFDEKFSPQFISNVFVEVDAYDLREFIVKELVQAKREAALEIVEYLDDLEIEQPEVLKTDNWRNWKYIRNSIVDKYYL